MNPKTRRLYDAYKNGDYSEIESALEEFFGEGDPMARVGNSYHMSIYLQDKKEKYDPAQIDLMRLFRDKLDLFIDEFNQQNSKGDLERRFDYDLDWDHNYIENEEEEPDGTD